MKDSISALSSQADSLAGDSALSDTIRHDTQYVLVIEPAKRETMPLRKAAGENDGKSWILGGLLILFVIIAIRFRNNSKYLATLLKSAIEVRERGNVFDDTVKESSFMAVLNVLWCLCAGILLYIGVGGRPGSAGAPAGMGFGVLLAMAYELFMIFSYWMVGNVFSDRLHARMWLRGFLAATGLTTLILFPTALIALCYPTFAFTAFQIGLGAFILGKTVFIWKGFRIFFTQIGAWVLFLYYLCSLEIVPLILLYLAAMRICI
ncbi:MAG: DUF4271 domain-containing protein [Muribaculaceae bacterium]|nr:DUF4271 domain-containing protein [Muribaculaceae bacterium]